MLIRKLERARAARFFSAALDDEHPLFEEDADTVISAFLSDRQGPHRGRPTNPDAVVHHLVTNGFTPAGPAWLPPAPAAPAQIEQGDGPLPAAPSESLGNL